MTFSNTLSRKTKEALRPLIELANILDAADIERFIKRNPGLIGLRPDYLQNQGGVREMKRFVLEGRPELKALLNDIRKVIPNYSEYEERELTLFLRQQVRELWRGGENGDENARSLLFTPALPWFEGEERMSPVGVDWKRGELAYRPLDGFQASLYALLKCSHLAKVCARPGCAAPYFVARRGTQQYCSTDCADVMQDEWRRRWWKEKGNEWRRKRKRRNKR